jgi:hypothetical protein
MNRDDEWYNSLANGVYPILKCPGCGHVPRRDNLRDSLHPTRFTPDCLFVFGCLVCEGGCDDWQVHGRTAKEAIDRWNWASQNPQEPDVLIIRQLHKQMGDSIGFWANRYEDTSQKLKEQTAITESLKRDLATLQGRTVQPCPAAKTMGEHACSNQHNCWEPCGSLGNDSRFTVVSRRKDPSVIFRGISVVNDVIPADPDPKNLTVRPARRAEASVDNGERRRKTD